MVTLSSWLKSLVYSIGISVIKQTVDLMFQILFILVLISIVNRVCTRQTLTK